MLIREDGEIICHFWRMNKVTGKTHSKSVIVLFDLFMYYYYYCAIFLNLFIFLLVFFSVCVRFYPLSLYYLSVFTGFMIATTVTSTVAEGRGKGC